MSGVREGDSARVVLQTEQFETQLAELDQGDQDAIWRSLKRARDGLPTFGIEKPWGGDWELWPCGAFRVLLRPLSHDEVEAQTGVSAPGLYLVQIEPAA
jgi:hypothetical protein